MYSSDQVTPTRMFRKQNTYHLQQTPRMCPITAHPKHTEDAGICMRASGQPDPLCQAALPPWIPPAVHVAGGRAPPAARHTYCPLRGEGWRPFRQQLVIVGAKWRLQPESDPGAAAPL